MRTFVGRALTVAFALLVLGGIRQYGTPSARFLGPIAVATIVVGTVLWLLALVDARRAEDGRSWLVNLALFPVIASAAYFFRPRSSR